MKRLFLFSTLFFALICLYCASAELVNHDDAGLPDVFEDPDSGGIDIQFDFGQDWGLDIPVDTPQDIDFDTPDLDAADVSDTDVSDVGLDLAWFWSCDPFAQTGCDAGQKCTIGNYDNDVQQDEQLKCGSAGTKDAGESCEIDAGVYQDQQCKKGTLCHFEWAGSIKCERLCGIREATFHECPAGGSYGVGCLMYTWADIDNGYGVCLENQCDIFTNVPCTTPGDKCDVLRITNLSKLGVIACYPCGTTPRKANGATCKLLSDCCNDGYYCYAETVASGDADPSGNCRKACNSDTGNSGCATPETCHQDNVWGIPYLGACY